MDEISTTLQLAMAAGLATTFDDNIYLTGFFSEINRSFRPQHVVIGELLGFSLLVAISLLSFLIGQYLPTRWLGWMGLLPILIGVRNLTQHLQRGYGDEADRQASHRLFGTLQGFAPRRLTLLQLLRDRQTYAVSLVTLANGSNNLSIYIPLFASLKPAQVSMVVPVLYGFVILWLTLSYRLTRAPGLALVLNRYAPIFFPFVLIWLGFRILNQTGSLPQFG
jgi:cadmium resistance protein CadD (predicted permease)